MIKYGGLKFAISQRLSAQETIYTQIMMWHSGVVNSKVYSL